MAKKQRATPHAAPPSLQPPAGAENTPKPAATAANNWRVDQADVPAKILDFYLAEYNQSRNEMTVYNNRIDRIILTYVSAIFAIFGYFLAVKDTPGSDLTSKMRSLLDLIQTNASMKSVLLVITILQAFLVLLVTAYTMTVYRHSKYTSTYLRPRVLQRLGIVEPKDVEQFGVLHFDVNRDVETTVVNRLRGLTAIGWYVFVLVTNIIVVAWLNSDLRHDEWYCILFTLVTALVNAAALGGAAIQAVYWNDLRFDQKTIPDPNGVSGFKIGLIDGSPPMWRPRFVVGVASLSMLLVYGVVVLPARWAASPQRPPVGQAATVHGGPLDASLGRSEPLPDADVVSHPSPSVGWPDGPASTTDTRREDRDAI